MLFYVEEGVVVLEMFLCSSLSVRLLLQFVIEGRALEGVCPGSFLACGEKLWIVSGLWE